MNESAPHVSEPPRKRVVVIVLGDIGRSPRMQYHAESHAKAGFAVDFVGYTETIIPERLLQHDVTIHAIPVLPPAPRGLFLVWAPIKVMMQIMMLCWLLMVSLPAPSHILVQNPPSIPTLIVAQWTSWIRGAKLVIDWHNLGYSILALRVGDDSRLVRVARWIERTYGASAWGHLFVTEAMRDHLSAEWGLIGEKVVLHDRPPEHFRRLTANERREFLTTIAETDLPSLADLDPAKDAVAVSATSWTDDEDFTVLLDALAQLDASPTLPATFPRRLYVVITGKGPNRAQFEEMARAHAFQCVRVVTAWLRVEDYPRLLGAADVGISLHTSSSGLDLPMKVVDMFGCGLPVCAFDFACLSELVNASNGRAFTTAAGLAKHLEDLLSDRTGRELMSTTIQSYFATHRWDVEWTTHALPLFASDPSEDEDDD
ncbi:mannosyltransferase [Blastocladiella emersonii ATCC 22665]|nr:mannosyltransferase [Blastocladiella emersonii ATCC 22665]